jgi:site-specific DNA-cytosine methylase
MRSTNAPLRALELYCGIGGCAAALAGGTAAVEVVAAVDIHRVALSVYRHNFPHPTVAATLEGLPRERLAAWGADLWWLSPPCQPFTRRGLGRDDTDPRSRGLLALLPHLAALRPLHLALENVPGFEGSRTHARLKAVLAEAGYEVAEHLLCPSEYGLPNRRRRFYLAASRRGLAPLAPPPRPALPSPTLAELLDPDPDPELTVDPALADRYRHALDVVEASDPAAVTACFTAAYGRSPVRSGSYLALPGGGLRRFSPAEILRLLGFPESFRLPPGLPRANAWRLVGNSLALPAVKAVLGRLTRLTPRFNV